jgi:hypothetical protein
METKDWITVAVAVLTLVSSWGQFWVKERLFSLYTPSSDTAMSAFLSKSGITFIAATGLTSAVAIWLLVVELQSTEVLNRMASFKISALTVLALLNVILVHSLFVLRRLAQLKKQVQAANTTAQQAIGLHWFL